MFYETCVEPSPRARWFQIGAGFIILLAFGLRLYAIGRQDIWGDEAFSIWLSRQPLPDVVAGGADTHPPLYPFLLFLWLRLAGSSPLAVRALSAFVGTLTVPVIHVLGRRVFGPATGLLAALLAALSPLLVYYSQETRMYGLVTLLAAASVYWAARLLQEPRRAGPWLAYFLTTLGAAYTHYYAFFIILAQNLVIVLALLIRCYRRRQKSALIRWLAVQAALALAYVPWIVVQSGFLSGKASARFGEWTLSTALRIAGETLSSFGAGLALPPTPSWIVTGLFLVAIAAGLAALIRCQRPESWLIVAYLFLPLGLAWLVNPIMPFFYARYLLLIAPAFYVLAAWGLASLGHRWRRLTAAGAVLLLAGSIFGLSSYYSDEVHVRGRYGQMMAYIEAQAQPGDAILLANPLQRPIFEYYRPASIPAHFFPKYAYPLEDPRTAADLEALAAEHPRLWLVRFGNPAEYDPGGTLTRWLATHGSKAYFDGWLDADLALYVMTPAAAADGATDIESIQHPLRANLDGQVQLLGYALSAKHVAPGETLLLTLYWQALTPMAEPYTVFTHLLAADGRVVAQMDSEPQGGGLPTDRWTAGQIVPDNYALLVAEDAALGPYVIEVGMYLLATMERLPATDAEGHPFPDNAVLLGTVEIGR